MNRRRRPGRRATLIAVIALAGVLGAVGIATGGPPPTVITGGGELNPSTLPKKRRAPAALTIRINAETTNPSGIPDPLTNVLLNFDDDGTVATKGLPVCKKDLNGRTTDEARRMCRSSMIGKGTAEAIAPPSVVPTDARSACSTAPSGDGTPRSSFTTMRISASRRP